MKSLLEVKNLSIGIRRGKNLLSSVEDVSFEIKNGEILGIVGESGSGKTLTALSIPGLLDASKEISCGKYAAGYGCRDSRARLGCCNDESKKSTEKRSEKPLP